MARQGLDAGHCVAEFELSPASQWRLNQLPGSQIYRNNDALLVPLLSLPALVPTILAVGVGVL